MRWSASYTAYLMTLTLDNFIFGDPHLIINQAMFLHAIAQGHQILSQSLERWLIEYVHLFGLSIDQFLCKVKLTL